MKKDEYVIHYVDFWSKTFLLNQNPGMSFAIKCQRKHHRQKEQNASKKLIAWNPLNHMMIIRHKHQNLEETIIYLVYLLFDYQYHQHQKHSGTHIVFMQETSSQAYQRTI